MQSVRFLTGAFAGLKRYAAGEIAGIPDMDAERLSAIGGVELIPLVASPEEETPKEAAPSILKRIKKPARRRRRK